MRYAFIADVHGNYDALDAVLGALDDLAPDRIFCLGDIVGYGAEPGLCVNALRERDVTMLAGNHDFAATERTSIEMFNEDARRSVEWTRANLGEAELAFLRQLPLVIQQDAFSLVHASLPDAAAFDYVLTHEDAGQFFSHMGAPLGLYAHSHLPASFFRRDGEILCAQEPSFIIPTGLPVLVNVGSVGQPRDSNPAASFVVYDSAPQKVSFHRREYNVERAAAKILAAGLPAANAYRLFLGR